ncbi:TetR/AcrR family transcriptional regulator [Solihabitans fulvus]|uniref:TetR/AcrR family transcriptional regulator n=1 Tax=Solihabitans fulvus TaxID=1892852 RepID=A0A5B2WEP1_9PSEU|nr:TetR/AcrR family transcriptional regulator [Solihabitans fulvus]KAA2248747.1 TetR/AcrR family transcriptional regulator [Solihabitans fulvus]
MTTTESATDRLLADQGGRRPRADARRNVARLVAAAREAVVEVGVDVTAHEIAHRAGVGIGTFYRRVPSREALLEAVLADLVTEVAEVARTLLSDPDPWHGFRTFAEAFVRLRVESKGINEALGRECGLDIDAPVIQLRERAQLLIERAQAAGALRADLTWQDVTFLLAGLSSVDRTMDIRAEPEQWRRSLHVVLDGLQVTDSVARMGNLSD